MEKLNWGIIGTGWIAHDMAAALKAVNGEVYAVCGTSMEKAVAFKRNTMSALHMAAQRICLQTTSWILYISQHRTIPIMSGCLRH